MIPIPIATPGRDREAGDRLQEALGSPRPGARREREQEGRNTDRDGGGDRELARQEREGAGRDRDRQADARR